MTRGSAQRIVGVWNLLHTPARKAAMALRLIGVDPDSPNNGSPTVWLDEGDQSIVIQGWKPDDDMISEITATKPIPGHETVVRVPAPSVSLGIIPMGLDRDAAWPVEDFWIFDDRQVNVELVSAGSPSPSRASSPCTGRPSASCQRSQSGALGRGRSSRRRSTLSLKSSRKGAQVRLPVLIVCGWLPISTSGTRGKARRMGRTAEGCVCEGSTPGDGR